MNKRIGVVLLGCSVGIIAFLNNQNKKFDEIDEKLYHLTKNIVIHDLEEVICEQDLYIDTLLWEVANLSWELNYYELKRKNQRNW